MPVLQSAQAVSQIPKGNNDGSYSSGAPLILQTNAVNNALQTLLNIDTTAGVVDGVNPISASQITPGVTTFSVENTFVIAGTGPVTDTYTVNDSLCGKRIYFDDTSPSTPKIIALSNAGMALFGVAQGPVMICNSQLNEHPVTFTLPTDLSYTYSLVPANAIVPPGMSAILTSNFNADETELYYCVEVLDGYAGTSAAQNLVLATPNGTPGVPVFRAIVAADLPGTINSDTTGNATTATNVTNIPIGVKVPVALNAQGTSALNSGAVILVAIPGRLLVVTDLIIQVTDAVFSGTGTVQLTDEGGNVYLQADIADLIALGTQNRLAFTNTGTQFASATNNSALSIGITGGSALTGNWNAILEYKYTS